MARLILMRGLPGSGKTTWAKQYQTDHPSVKRINRDDLRMMIDNGVWTKQNEKMIRDIRDYLVSFFLSYDYTVIVDDTNLDRATETRFRTMVAEMNRERSIVGEGPIEVTIQEMDTSVSECIKRDAKRKGSAKVGKDVIMRFFNQYYDTTSTSQ